MQPFLPQNDPNPAQRQSCLEKGRKEYQFMYDFFAAYGDAQKRTSRREFFY